MALAEVVTIYETNARSIPDMLHMAANTIAEEADEGVIPTVAMVAVQLSGDGSVQTYGWGDLDTFKAIAMLHLGLQDIGNLLLDDGAD